MANNIPIIFNVNPVLNENPNIILNETGNRVQLILNDSLRLPENTKAKIALKSFTAFYSFPNIKDGEISVVTSTNDSTIIQFPTGLYDTKQFQTQVNQALDVSFSPWFTPASQILFVPNFATEKLQIELVGVTIPPGETLTITMNPTLQNVTGFTSPVVMTSASNLYGANDYAHFNQINNILLKTSLLNTQGIQVNNSTARNQNIIDIVNINVKPSKQIIHQPNELYFYDISLSEPIQEIRFEILDENGNDILINNSYMFNLILRYE